MVYPAREAPAHCHHGLPVRDEYFVVQPEIQRQAIAPLRPRLKLEAAQAFIFADNIRGIALGWSQLWWRHPRSTRQTHLLTPTGRLVGLWPSKGAHDNAESEYPMWLSWQSRPIHRLLTIRVYRISPRAKNLTSNSVSQDPERRSPNAARCKIQELHQTGQIAGSTSEARL